MTVLIVAVAGDLHVARVTELLRGRGVDVHHIDTGAFPADMRLAATISSRGLSGFIATEGSGVRVSLSDITSAWFRNAPEFTLRDDIPTGARMWAIREARGGLGGVLNCLPWLNHPADIAAAEFKPWQLVTAVAAGLTVPDTLVTNDPAAGSMFGGGSQTIYRKRLAGEAPPGGRMFTTELPGDQLDASHWQSLAQTAHMLQYKVDKTYEVRLTMVDGVSYAVRIDGGGRIDWRDDVTSASYQLIKAPEKVVYRVSGLLQRLRLRFAAVDFLVDDGDNWTFLELNPNGQFLWVDDEASAQVADAVARALA